jgi:hypothetical protein
VCDAGPRRLHLRVDMPSAHGSACRHRQQKHVAPMPLPGVGCLVTTGDLLRVRYTSNQLLFQLRRFTTFSMNREIAGIFCNPTLLRLSRCTLLNILHSLNEFHDRSTIFAIFGFKLKFDSLSISIHIKKYARQMLK